MKTLFTTALIALIAAPAFSFAQSPEITPSAPVMLPSIVATGQAVLRSQTPIILRMSEELTTKKKKLRVGQRFNLEVAEPVIVNGATVIPVGSPATGEITEVRNKGMWGKSGYVGAQLVQVRVGDRTIRLTGSFDDKGVTGTGGVVASIVFIPIAGFFTTGTSALIPMGAQIKGYIGEDVPLNLQVSTPQPMNVPAAPAPMPVVAAPTAVSAPK